MAKHKFNKAQKIAAMTVISAAVLTPGVMSYANPIQKVSKTHKVAPVQQMNQEFLNTIISKTEGGQAVSGVTYLVTYADGTTQTITSQGMTTQLENKPLAGISVKTLPAGYTEIGQPQISQNGNNVTGTFIFKNLATSQATTTINSYIINPSTGAIESNQLMGAVYNITFKDGKTESITCMGQPIVLHNQATNIEIVKLPNGYKAMNAHDKNAISANVDSQGNITVTANFKFEKVQTKYTGEINTVCDGNPLAGVKYQITYANGSTENVISTGAPIKLSTTQAVKSVKVVGIPAGYKQTGFATVTSTPTENGTVMVEKGTFKFEKIDSTKPVVKPDTKPTTPDTKPVVKPDTKPTTPDTKPVVKPDTKPTTPDTKPVVKPDTKPTTPDTKPVVKPDTKPTTPDTKPVVKPDTKPTTPDTKPVVKPDTKPTTPDTKPVVKPDTKPTTPDTKPVVKPDTKPTTPDTKPVVKPDTKPTTPDTKPVVKPDTKPTTPDTKPVVKPNTKPTTTNTNSNINKVAKANGTAKINSVKGNTSTKNTNTDVKTTNPKTGDQSELPFVFGAIAGLGLLISVNLRKVKEKILKSNK
ncbi:MAG: hypothetical protein ACRDAU_03265 [Clostridium sp.]